MADFAHQPVIRVGVEEMLVGDDLGRIARGFEHDRGDVEFVEPDVQDGVVEFAGELERPELGAERQPWRRPMRAAASAGPRSVIVAMRRARSNSTASEP